MIEMEAKFEITEIQATQLSNKLMNLAYRSEGAIFERNYLFDNKEQDLTHKGEVLRVRSRSHDRYNSQTTTYVTHKEKNEGSLFLHREEFEFECPNKIIGLLKRLGYNEVFRYDRWRRIYRPTNPKVGGEVCIDHFERVEMQGNSRVFIELEGWDGWINEMIKVLGLDIKNAIPCSYREYFTRK